MPKGQNTTNKQVSHLLESVAAALIIKKANPFRISAYQRAASAIEHLTSDIKDLWDDKKLEEIPGVGKSIAGHLDEFFKTGKVRHFERLLKGFPAAMFELLKISGIGPSKAFKLTKSLSLSRPETAIDQLKKAIGEQKIREIEGFGEQSEQDIRQALTEFESKDKRLSLLYASQLAQDIISFLKKCPFLKKVDILGSLRRRCATIGDIDISGASDNPQEAIDWFCQYPKRQRIIESGPKKARIIITGGNQVDLMVEPPESYGSLLQHFTGSKQHNIHLREIALEKGLSLSEHGIKINKKYNKFGEEKELYRYLGMEWIPPELREDSGEIEAAIKHKLPKLIEQEDIKGDLQMHTSFDIESSHDTGADSMEKMASKGRQLGYQYLAFTDHNPSITNHTDNQIISVLTRRKAFIDKLNYSCEKVFNNRNKKLFVFNSLEIDIRPNGELSIPPKGLEMLDFALVSVHSSFKLDKQRMTNRLIKALSHPKVKILAHPTGRLIDKREGFEVDWELLFKFCRENNKYLEINSFPDRLDLPDTLVREAIINGIKLVVSTDAHAASQLDYMAYGVDVARRGWARKGDIINTLSYNEIRKLLVN